MRPTAPTATEQSPANADQADLPAEAAVHHHRGRGNAERPRRGGQAWAEPAASAVRATGGQRPVLHRRPAMLQPVEADAAGGASRSAVPLAGGNASVWRVLPPRPDRTYPDQMTTLAAVSTPRYHHSRPAIPTSPRRLRLTAVAALRQLCGWVM